MIEQSLEVGPFTPQELDEICKKLRIQSISFEVLKDEEAEKNEMRNDFANLVKKTEFRVETYLGQVFYLKISQDDFHRMAPLFAEYGMATNPVENPDELKVADMKGVHEDAVEQRSLQSLLAWSLLAVLVSYGLWKLFN